MWAMPVESLGGVLKSAEKDLFSSSFTTDMTSAPVARWRSSVASEAISTIVSCRSTSNPAAS